MNLTYTPEQQTFRDEIRSFLKEQLQPALSDKVEQGLALTKRDYEQWHATLHAHGYLAANWPAQYGGAEWDAVQRHIFDEECALAHAPEIVPFGLTMLGPVLQKFGSAAQQDYWLPRILKGLSLIHI